MHSLRLSVFILFTDLLRCRRAGRTCGCGKNECCSASRAISPRWRGTHMDRWVCIQLTLIYMDSVLDREVWLSRDIILIIILSIIIIISSFGCIKPLANASFLWIYNFGQFQLSYMTVFPVLETETFLCLPSLCKHDRLLMSKLHYHFHGNLKTPIFILFVIHIITHYMQQIGHESTDCLKSLVMMTHKHHPHPYEERFHVELSQ